MLDVFGTRPVAIMAPSTSRVSTCSLLNGKVEEEWLEETQDVNFLVLPTLQAYYLPNKQ